MQLLHSCKNYFLYVQRAAWSPNNISWQIFHRNTRTYRIYRSVLLCNLHNHYCQKFLCTATKNHLTLNIVMLTHCCEFGHLHRYRCSPHSHRLHFLPLNNTINTPDRITVIYSSALCSPLSFGRVMIGWKGGSYFFSSMLWFSHGTGSFSCVSDPPSLSCQNCSTSGKTLPSLRLTVSASLPPPSAPTCSGWGWASLVASLLQPDWRLLSPRSWPEVSGLGQGDWRVVGLWGPGLGGSCLRRVRRLQSPL